METWLLPLEQPASRPVGTVGGFLSPLAISTEHLRLTTSIAVNYCICCITYAFNYRHPYHSLLLPIVFPFLDPTETNEHTRYVDCGTVVTNHGIDIKLVYVFLRFNSSVFDS